MTTFMLLTRRCAYKYASLKMADKYADVDTFTRRKIVILASTAAQANYWARLNSALGVPSAGFMEEV